MVEGVCSGVHVSRHIESSVRTFEAVSSDLSDLQVFPGQDMLIVPSEDSDVAWACLYTRPRHEKSLARVCWEKQIPYYLPLRRVIRRYQSGKKVRWLPLFPGYLFCCTGRYKRYELRQQDNLLKLIDVHNPEKLVTELREVRKALSVSEELETVPYLAEGKRVRIARGPFRGVYGIVKKEKRRYRVLLNVTLVGRAVELNLDAGDLEPVS